MEKTINKEYKPGSVVCAPIFEKIIECVHCGDSTGKETSELEKVKGASQFACGSCGRVAIYRYGDFPGNSIDYKQEPIEMEDWAEHLSEEDFL